MTAERVAQLIVDLRAIESSVASLRRRIDGEELTVSDRQYLTRCFDLLDMELGALRQYIDALP